MNTQEGQMLEIKAQSQNAIVFAGVPVSRQHDIYISGMIQEPEEYVEVYNLIRNAASTDTIVIHINSYGGDAASTIQFLAALDETDATVVCSAEGNCMSAATMLFLAGDFFEVSPFATFMFHNYSGGTAGKGGEMYDHISFERKATGKFIKAVYKDFFSKKEINRMLDGKDFWMDTDEVIARLEFREKQNQKRKSRLEKSGKS